MKRPPLEIAGVSLTREVLEWAIKEATWRRKTAMVKGMVLAGMHYGFLIEDLQERLLKEMEE